jgi:hypothetical protein
MNNRWKGRELHGLFCSHRKHILVARGVFERAAPGIHDYSLMLAAEQIFLAIKKRKKAIKGQPDM